MISNAPNVFHGQKPFALVVGINVKISVGIRSIEIRLIIRLSLDSFLSLPSPSFTAFPALTKDEQRLNHQLDRFSRQLPAWMSMPLRWLRRPSARWVRIPVGCFLMVAGIFSFLPVLGLWMLPLGLILLAQDLPFLRRPMRRMMICLERRWIRWKRRRRRS